jgi:adenylate cyclase
VTEILTERLLRLVPKEYAERLLATRGQVGHERRTVTILFSDVKGSTAMAHDLDPEDVLEIMDGAFDVLIEPVYRYEGTLARLMGDAVLAFFGAPIAHEDDAERACRAALDIIAEAQRYAERLQRERGIEGFNVRVGIHTGLVVVGEAGSDLRVEYTAMGDAINLASRIESAAEPGRVLVTGATHKLVAPLFETEALGTIEVKGCAEPVSVYRVHAARPTAAKPRGIAGLASPLVGREVEFGALREVVEGLQEGVGGVVTVMGEAGMGKSRLVAEARKIGATHLRWVEGRCLSYGKSIAYLLWLDVLRNLLGVTAEDSPLTVQTALQDRVQGLCPSRFEEVCPFLARLLSLPLEKQVGDPSEALTGQEVRERTFRAVEKLLACTAQTQPLVVVCEDLHWADPTSLDLLRSLLPLTDQVPLLFLCLMRPVRDHQSWQLHDTILENHTARHTDLWLASLSSDESETLVANLLSIEEGTRSEHATGSPPELQKRILSRAEGNPFFLEEILRSLIDQGVIVRDEATGRWHVTAEGANVAIPDTLQGVLLARIDQLQEETRRVLQLAAVIGRTFPYRILAEIAAAEAAAYEDLALEQRMEALQQEDMIRERARLPELEYAFRHDLTREAAYDSLLKRDRRAYHRQVAQALEHLFRDRIEEQVNLLAHHWDQAREPERAIHYLGQAGDRAARLSANEEAAEHYRRGLALIRGLPGTPEQVRQELALQTRLVTVLIALRGYGHPKVGAAVGRALELGRRAGDDPQLFLPILALAAFHGGRGEYRQAEGYWRELVGMAERVGDPLLIALSHWLGWVPLFLGQPAGALAHLEQLIEFYDPQQHGSLKFIYGVDPGAICRIWSSWALWLLGYPTQALKRAQEALALAEQLDHPHTLAFVLAVGCETHRFRRDRQATQEWAEALARLLAEHPFEYWMARAMAIQGWMLAEQGDTEEGITLMKQSLAATRSAGSEMYAPVELARVARAFGRAGRVQEGLGAAEEALAVAGSTGERYCEAEIYRLRGELLMKASEAGAEGGLREAEISFRKALAVAQEQGAKSWDLRTTMSLYRLRQRQGRPEEARRMLSEVYGWFTEGFDTPDLREARALLEELP